MHRRALAAAGPLASGKMNDMAMDLSPDYLKRLLEAVNEFRDDFELWMETQNGFTHSEARGLYPTVSTKEGVDRTEVQRLALKVAESAGLMAPAVRITGTYIGVVGIGNVDPIANWTLMDSPRALVSPEDIRRSIATIVGRLRSLALDVEESGGDGVPTFGPFALHPTVWGAAVSFWTTGKYRVAVREAAEALNAEWKTKLRRSDVDDTVFWQQTLSAGDPEPGRPKLVWPGEHASKSNKSIRGGLPSLARALNDFATGLNLTVRNIATHELTELSEQEALERLGAYSYFARMLDGCELHRAENDGDDAPPIGDAQ